MPGKAAKDFIQEWKSYKSLDEALATINGGKEIYKDDIGVFPDGGKYCGYISNEFSDDDTPNFKENFNKFKKIMDDFANEIVANKIDFSLDAVYDMNIVNSHILYGIDQTVEIFSQLENRKMLHFLDKIQLYLLHQLSSESNLHF